jgi:3-hydroxyisobutyrate dehydrogenase-like beta-hydroxyacid dehydrogenase
MAAFHPDVSPSFSESEQPVIGIIGMGAMGKMYAKHLSDAGWRKSVDYLVIVVIVTNPTSEFMSATGPKSTIK